MASIVEHPKDDLPSPPLVVPSSSALSHGGVLSPLTNIYQRLSSWRKALDLPNPGTIENMTREAKNTTLTNFMFDGARADLTKSLSVNPAFQVTHSFTMGSQVAPPTYNFGAVYITDDVLLQGGMDHDGNLNARFNQAWAKDKTNVTKMQASLTPGHNMLQLEHEYQGQDYSLNIKGMNPSPIDSTGIYIGSILQSLTKNLALGVEAIYQRPQPDVSEMAASYVAKYTSSNKDWIATTQMQPSQGVLQATYWQKFGEKVEVAADLMLIAAPTRRDAIATLGARYDLRMSSFRAQLDSTGKVSVLHEQRFAPAFAFLLSGEIDHFRNSAKVGVGVMIDSSSMSPEDMQMAQMPHPPQ